MTKLEELRRNTEKAYQNALRAMMDVVNAITEERNYYMGLVNEKDGLPANDIRGFEQNPYTMEEVISRLSPNDGKAGEWYTDGCSPDMAWCIDMVDDKGNIVRKLCHNKQELTVTPVDSSLDTETVAELAKNFIELGYYFLKDSEEG